MRTVSVIGLCGWLAFAIVSAKSSTHEAGSTTRSNDVDVEYVVKESVSLHEPVAVVFSVHNGLSQPITLTLGAQSRQFFQFSLTTPDRQVLQNSRNPGEEVDVVTVGSGTTVVAPGADYKQTLLMNQWFTFKTPGTYLLIAKLTTNIDVSGDGSLPPRNQAIRLQIKPRDPAHLNMVCAELAKQVAMAPNAEAAQDPALKLSLIEDPIVVPYLVEVLSYNKLIDHLVIPGLGRIGTDDAVEALLYALDSGLSDRAQLARQALTRMEDRISNPNLKETVKRALAREAPPVSPSSQ